MYDCFANNERKYKMRISLINCAKPVKSCSVGVMSGTVVFGNAQEKSFIPLPDVGLGCGDQITRMTRHRTLLLESIMAELHNLPDDISTTRLALDWNISTPNDRPVDNVVARKLNELAGNEIGAYGATRANFERKVSRGAVLSFAVRSQRGLNLLSTVLQDIYLRKLSVEEVLRNLAENARKFLG